MTQKEFFDACETASVGIDDTTPENLLFAVFSLPEEEATDVFCRGALTQLAKMLVGAAEQQQDLAMMLVLAVNELPGLEVYRTDGDDPMPLGVPRLSQL